MKQGIVRDILYNWSGMLGGLLYAFFMTPIIIKELGTTNYGLWNLIMGVVGYLAILDFGLQSSVNRFVAKFRAVEDADSVNSIYANALSTFGMTATVFILVGTTISLYLDRFFSIPKGSEVLVREIALLMAIYGGLELPLSVYGSILYAYQKFNILNLVSVGTLALQSVLLLLMFNYDCDFFLFPCVIIFVGLCRYALQFFFTKRTIKTLSFKFKLLSRDLFYQMLKFSGTTFVAQIVSNIIFRTDNIIIGIFLTPKAVGIYSVGFMITEYAVQLIGRMSNVLTPKFCEHQSRDNLSERDALLYSSTRYSILLGFPIGLSVLVVGGKFIKLWIGADFAESYYVMALLMGARMCGIPTVPLYSMLYGIGSHHLTIYAGAIEAALNLVLSLILVRAIGITGVAWGTFIPMIFGNIILVRIVFGKLGLNIGDWFRKSLLHPFLFSATFFASIYLFDRLFAVASWHSFFVEVAGIICIYAVMMVAIGINKNERRQLVSLLYAKG